MVGYLVCVTAVVTRRPTPNTPRARRWLITSDRPYRVSFTGTANGVGLMRYASGRRVTNLHVICVSNSSSSAASKESMFVAAARCSRGS